MSKTGALSVELVTTIVRFILSGVFGAVFNLSLLYILTSVAGLWYLTAGIIAFSASLIVSFALQKFITFRDHSRTQWKKQFASFTVLALSNLAANTAFLYFFTSVLGMYYILSQVFSSGLIAVWSFFMYGKLIFSPTASRAEKQVWWKRYYYQYMQHFLTSLIANNARTLWIRHSDQSIPDGETYEYVIAQDVLGRVYDVELFFRCISQALASDGRVIVTHYNVLWEPFLRLATFLRLRHGAIEKTWLSRDDLENLFKLSGFEVVTSGTKMLIPVYIPLVSWVCNVVFANIWPFSRLGLFHYVVARKIMPREFENPSLSIIIPARNEAGTIRKMVEMLPELGGFTELVFVEGGSRDDTAAVIQQVVAEQKRNIRSFTQKGRGKGDAVRVGFARARGDILMIYDADMTVPPEEVKKFYDALVNNRGDFINGSRLVYGLEKESMRLLNLIANKFFGIAFTWLLGQRVKDTLCGTKVLWKHDYEKIEKGRVFFGDFDPFGDFDLLFGAAKLHLAIVDVPVHYKSRVYGTTNISRFSHGWLLLKMVAFAATKLKFV